MVSPISAVNAYNKALEAHKKIKASMHEANSSLAPRAILRGGDDFKVLQNSTATWGVEPSSKSQESSFRKVLQEALVQSPINSLTKASQSMFELSEADGQELGPDVLELMESVNTAQLTLNTILTVRESFVEAYKAILNMPI
jgi:flagellar hook-basal body complex protein FliE